MEKGLIIPAVIEIYSDRTFTFVLRTPPAAVLIKKAIKLEKGSPESHKTKVGKISQAQIKEIAELKAPDLNANDVNAAMKIIAGTARSMGVTVEA
jgi:large subunit ribosomal protein L11